MTAHRDLKIRIRDRQAKTGESYVAARTAALQDRDALLTAADQHPIAVTEPPTPTPGGPPRLDAVVLKVDQQSARVRILAEEGQVTFRSVDACDVVPGHLVTLVVEKRWTWKGHAYASGAIENPRIDVAALGLVPLPLHGGHLEDLRSTYEAFRHPDPYVPLWRFNTDHPRRSFEMDSIAWGTFPGADIGDNPTCDASELVERGDPEGARQLLMDTLFRDLRCLDAHAHLGNLEFDHDPEGALAHYEMGVRIGDLSLPPGFDGVLVWGITQNRPFLRCLHGYGLCLWRLGRLAQARAVFERMLSLNPNDNQGVRHCWRDVRNGQRWKKDLGRESALGR